jgi:hypothetical protein
MEPEGAPQRPGKAATAISGRLKVYFAVALALVAGVIGYTVITRAHAAQSTVKRAFDLVAEGDLEGAMELVDPQGQLGTMWNQNQEGARDKLLSLMGRYRLQFDSLEFKTRAEGSLAEVELAGGTVTIYSQNGDGLPQAVLDLGGSDLVFELEKKDGKWLIQGVNYDVSRILSGELPF